MTLSTQATRQTAARTSSTKARRNAFGGTNLLVYAVALVVVALTVAPVLYGVISGFRTNSDLSRNPSGWPEPWVLTNYAGVLTSSTFWGYTFNSVMVALITTLIVVFAGVMAGYPLARYQFRLREPLYLVFVMGLLFPAAVAVIPLFIMITNDFGWADTWWGIALPQAAFALPVTIVILRPFLMGDPQGPGGGGDARRGVADRLLLADPAPAVRTGHGHRRRAGLRRLVERVPPAPAPASQRDHEDAPARRGRLLDPLRE